MKINNIMALLLIAIAVSAQDVSADLHPDCNNKGKWGYVDDHGNVVVKHSFTGASEFDEGVAHVLSGKKYGIINEQGEYVVKPEYDVISPFNIYGLAQVTKGNKNGFVDRQGNVVIPVRYTFVGDFNADGIIWVNEGGRVKKGETTVSGGEFSLLRSDGSNMLGDAYARIGTFVPYTYSYTKAQKDKMSTTERRLTEGENYVFWKRVYYGFTPGKPVNVSNLGMWASGNNDGTYNGVFDKDGKVIIPVGRYYIANRPNCGIAVVLTTSDTYNFLEIESGGLVMDDPIDSAWSFNNGYCIGTKRGLQYIYDKKGKQRSEGYSHIYPANNGVHVIRNGSDKYGLIRESGEVILEPNNYSVYPFTGGASLVKATSKSKAGYIGKNGEWIIPPTYDNGFPFDGDRAIVKLDGKWGMVDNKNTVLIPFEFYTMQLKGDHEKMHYWVQRIQDGKFELYDIAAGKSVIGPEYVSVYPFDASCADIALVNPGKGKETWGWIDTEGNVVIPFEYNLDLAFKAGHEYDDSGRSPWTEYRALMFRLRHDSHPVGLDTTVSEDKWDF